jgi:hypothetical protein
MGRSCSTNGGEEERVQVIGKKLTGKETTRKTRRRWVDNIRMDVVEVVWGDVDWIGLAQVNSSCEFGIEPSGSIKCWKSIEWLHNWWPLE